MIVILRRIALPLFFLAFLGVPLTSLGDVAECGTVEYHAGQYGPYDYRDRTEVGKSRLHLVEVYHFTPDVQSLKKGSTAALPAHDLDYTLRAFPNHHQALFTMINYYTDALARSRPPMPSSAECYLERAIQFRPDDETVWTLYGIYLTRVDRLEDAIAKFKHAEGLNPGSAEVHYNLGLVYLKLGKTQEALKEAHIAYGKHFPLMGLKKELKARGVWKEP